MLYSCTHMTTVAVGVKGLKLTAEYRVYDSPWRM